LTWNDSTKRWVRGREDDSGSPGKTSPLPDVYDAWQQAPDRAKEYLAAAIYNATGHDPTDRIVRGPVDQDLLARRIASEYAHLADAGGTPEELASLAKAAAAVGIKPRDEVGETGPFESVAYTGPAGLFPGDPVRVVRPALVRDGRIIVKGTVEPI